MRQLLEAQAVSNFGDIPIRLFEQDPCFLYQPACNMLGGGFAGVFL